MMVCDMLEKLVREVVADAGTLKEAIGVARVAELDPAILDLRLGDETTELVAEITRVAACHFSSCPATHPMDCQLASAMSPIGEAGSPLRTREDDRKLREILSG
jgi:hypothetical protein